MRFDPGLQVGDIITNKCLYTTFQCGNCSGMRRSRALGTLVIVSDHTKEFYDDKWKEGILHYTGMGKKGDQVLEGNQNKTLYESDSNGIIVHLFEVYEKGRYTYRGIVKLAEKPYQSEQKDVEGVLRKVWIFPVRLVQDDISIESDADEKLVDKMASITDEELERVGYVYTPQPEKRGVPVIRNNVEMYPRSKERSKNALAYAGFVCEIDEFHPTFIRKKSNKNYVEPHHLIPMKYSKDFKNSLDVEANIVSLCSNCHNQIHYGRDYEVLLKKLYDKRKDALKQAGISVTFEEVKEMYS